MISRAETGFALRGLLRVLRFDPSFPQFFDRSPNGAIRSFWIYCLLIGWNVLAFSELRDAHQGPMTSRMWWAYVITQIINVIYFPAVLLAIGKYIDRASHVVGCITVYNWLNLITLPLKILLDLFAWLHFDLDAQLILQILVLSLGLIWEGFVLAVCLRISLLFAAAFVALDFVLGEILFNFMLLIAHAPLF